MKQKIYFVRAGMIIKTGWLRSGTFLCVSLLLTLFFWTGGQFVKADAVISTVPAGSGPNAVAVNSVTNKIYVANQTSNNVTVIDGTNNSTTNVAVGAFPIAITINSATNKIYVANADSNNVTVIDGGNNSTQTLAVGTFPNGIAVNSITNKIYIANLDSNTVTVIDGGNNSTQTVAVGSAPRAVEVNSATNKIYVANQLSNNVTVIDGTNNSTTNVAVGTFPIAMAINSSTNKIYVANADSNNVTVIDGSNNSTTTVTTGSIPVAAAVNSSTNTIYVANQTSNNITIIDGGNNSTTTLAAGSTPVAIAVNSVTNKIYVANADSNNVTVIDGGNNSTQTLVVGLQPNAVAVNSVTNKIYVANLEDNTVTVIDGTSTPIVSGRVTYANASTTTPVPFTTINAAGSIPLSRMTDANGFYSLSGFGSGAYTVTPSKTNQVNGISNLDASTVAQHVAGLVTLNANQLIAADASGNGTVSSLDVAYIAQFAASIPNPSIIGSWKFLPSSRLYPNVLTNQTGQDFSAILVGDVTGNWNPAGPLRFDLSATESELATQAEKVAKVVEEKAAQEEGVTITASANESAGKETAMTLDLTAAETTGEGILGYQFDVLYDKQVIEPQTIGCDVSETISSGMTAICHAVEPGVLKVVVFGATPLTGSGTMLKLNFKVIGAKDSTSGVSIENFIFNEGLPNAVTVRGQ